MIDITFITSNQTKLAHARYLANKYDITIFHYKKKFYGIGYIEPRILDQKQLLEESINDAIKRWKKNVSKNGTQLFFIEDTSVKLDALSDDENEVPGVDIKYWMQEHSFDELDKELRKSGNNRKASVTSHLVLFLTKDIQEKIESDKEYIIFVGNSYGNIVEKEYSFEAQILYPWLDNKTFNKWFVPDGFDLPMSMLNIIDANRADFRKGAFEQMLHFLGKYNDLGYALNELKLTSEGYFLPFVPMYIICGPTCAGKSTIGKYLLENFNYYHIEASDFMSLKYFETNGTKFSVEKNVFAAELLKVEPLIVVENTLKFIQSKKIYSSLVVTGFRTSDEVLKFQKIFSHQDVKVIYITADFEIRFNRWTKRQRDNTKYTKEKFVEINKLQEKMGLSTIETIKNIIYYENNQDGIDMLFNDFKEKFIRMALLSGGTDLNSIVIQKMSLEKTILVVLAIEYKKNECCYYTTTEISHLINRKFKKLNKNKNNISRYFNQSYYPYYEIKRERNKIKYKLSPTGYSEANFIIQKILKNNEKGKLIEEINND
jgi:adenylate kinase family enzyme/inosine/xanthosine triphosphate pyrophosphatase family protein